LVKGRSGFVLISVIFITALLAVSTTAFVANVRSHTLFARALLYNHQLEAAADGMVRLTALQFATRDVSKPFPMQQACRWNKDISITYMIQDQAGLVDLNTANPALLVAVLLGLGETEARAISISSAVADYKDPDTQSQSGGDESAIYQNPGTGPSNGPFATIEELDRIPVITDTLYARLLPLVTVHSQQTGIDPAQAPKLLQDVVKADATNGASFMSPSSARVYSVVATAWREKAGTFTRSAIISLTGQPDKPFALLKWSVTRQADASSSIPLRLNACFSGDNVN
jgi:general secretion pathway protein K